jgi:predicted ester cyclase
VPNSPAAGILQVKDEIVRAVDAEKTWETFQDLKSGLWGNGVMGTSVTVTVKRDGKLLEIPLKRGRIEGYDMKLSTSIEMSRDYILKYWPDIHAEIKMIIGEGDLVAIYMINSGTNLEYHHSAVWDETDIFRLKDEKIIEMWGVENSYASMKQLGYQILPPVTSPVA